MTRAYTLYRLWSREKAPTGHAWVWDDDDVTSWLWVVKQYTLEMAYPTWSPAVPIYRWWSCDAGDSEWEQPPAGYTLVWRHAGGGLIASVMLQWCRWEPDAVAAWAARWARRRERRRALLGLAAATPALPWDVIRVVVGYVQHK